MLVEEELSWCQAEEYCRNKNAYLAELIEPEGRDTVWNYTRGRSNFSAFYVNELLLLSPANEVWGKVIFSEACVKSSVHRVGSTWAGAPPPGQGTPPGPGTPPCRYTHPPTPQTRYTPAPGQVHPPDQVHPTQNQVHPPGPGTSPRQVQPPDQVHPQEPGTAPPPLRAVNVWRYGQQAGGTHPTGMHSCFHKKVHCTVHHSVFIGVNQRYFHTVSMEGNGLILINQILISTITKLR